MCIAEIMTRQEQLQQSHMAYAGQWKVYLEDLTVLYEEQEVERILTSQLQPELESSSPILLAA